ncbi:unnamed protein product [Adineta ricciae]|uniref:Uncharacterized protein n=1 Tax=Adineta ricciae TaxID=249248 RepID=A0A814ERH2_ADIRI|nr:unnamed protein product [Adineta ricciae]
MTTNKISSPSIHHFSWEEWDDQMIVILYRSDQRFVVKRYIERVLANSTQWQRIARSSFANLEPIAQAYTMTENEVKLMHHIFSWHLDGTLKFPIIGGLDQLLDWEDVLDFIAHSQQMAQINQHEELVSTNSPAIFPTIPVGIKKKLQEKNDNAENTLAKKGNTTPMKKNKKVIPRQLLDESSAGNHWVQINNICVPYIIKSEQTRFLPYQVILDCELLNDQEQAFLIDFTVKASPNDIRTFERIISSSSSIDFSLNKDLLLIDLYHLIFGISKVVYVKLVNNQRDVNKGYKTVLAQCGGTFQFRSQMIPFISLGKFDYVLLDSISTILPSTTKMISNLRRHTVSAQTHEIDYLRLIQFYHSRHYQDPNILIDQQQSLISTHDIHKYIEKDDLIVDMSLTQYQQHEYQMMRKRTDGVETRSMKKSTKRKASSAMADVQNTT